jgi:hypothetical protein
MWTRRQRSVRRDLPGGARQVGGRVWMLPVIPATLWPVQRLRERARNSAGDPPDGGEVAATERSTGP